MKERRGGREGGKEGIWSMDGIERGGIGRCGEDGKERSLSISLHSTIEQREFLR